MGLSAQGTTISVRNAGNTADIAIGEVTNINGPSSSRGEIDDTHLTSTGKEYLLGLADHGEVQLDLAFKPGDAGQQELQNLFDTDPPAARVFKITFPIDVDAGHASATTLTFTARVQSAEFGIQVESRIELSISLRVTGGRTLVEGS